MDFGTTNSGMALFDGRHVRLLPLDPANTNPAVARTALYITNDQNVHIGRDALDTYFEQNVGRPVKMQRVWVGEVEVYGADMRYVTDVYAWVDILSPGRLFLSIKSGLRDPEYQGTVVGQHYFSLEDLIATYMSLARLRAEQLLERPVEQVVLGRPVRFGDDDQADTLAQQRLLDAAFRAGFKTVYLQPEPVAAAYHYARDIGTTQNVLVFDFGGGTLDLTVMRLEADGGRRVLATGGVPIAGDIFDQKLVRAKLPPHFGEGSRYGPPGRRMPLPRWIFDAFSSWQTIMELQTPENRTLLEELVRTGEQPGRIEALLNLVTQNYGLQMFDTVEAAKRALSDKMAATIQLDGPGFRVRELVTRAEFERIIRAEIVTIEQHLDETVRASGLASADIDAVVRTGGSSNVPAFRYMLMEKYGASKVLAADTFSSVTSGLGIMAQAIAAGGLDATAYTAADLPPTTTAGSQTTHVAEVNLSLLQRRLQAQESAIAGSNVGMTLITVDGQQALRLTSLPASLDETIAWDEAPERVTTALLVRDDEPLLLVTNLYRFFLTTTEHLNDLHQLAIQPADFFHFKAHETVTTVADWTALRRAKQLVLVTSRGFVRLYALNGLVEAVEGPTPYGFDQPLPGVPLAVLSASDDASIVVALDSGRATRTPLAKVPLQGWQAIHRRQEERLAGALLARAEEILLLATATGYGKRQPLDHTPVAERANTRGLVQISRKPLAGLTTIGPGQPAWALTSRALRSVDLDELPIPAKPTSGSTRMLKLASGERLLAFPYRRST